MQLWGRVIVCGLPITLNCWYWLCWHIKLKAFRLGAQASKNNTFKFVMQVKIPASAVEFSRHRYVNSFFIFQIPDAIRTRITGIK